MIKELIKSIFGLRNINYFRMHYQAFKSNVKISQQPHFIDVIYNFKNKDIKLNLRKYPSSDWLVFNQIFLFREYESLFNYAAQTLSKDKTISIIDGGANIGLTSIYAKFHFENSSIYCVEPSINNIEFMKTNFRLNNIKDFHVIHGALWNKKTELAVQQTGAEWAITVSDSKGDTEINSFTILEIMELNKIEILDILKLDIEGSERELFNSKPEVFLSKTKFIAIEVHESYISKERVNGILKDNYFETFESGELIIGKNLKLV